MAVIEKDGALRGTVANYVYRRYRNLNIIQSKPGRVRQTYNSKESSLEFGLCSTTAKQIRYAFDPAVRAYDGGMINRFGGLVRRSLQACRSKRTGERDFHDAALSMLEGFQFNTASPLTAILKVRPQVSLMADNRIRVQLPEFREQADIKGPARVAYYILRTLVLSFDFKKEVYRYVCCKDLRIERSALIPAQDWQTDEPIPAGRVVLVSTSLHAYVSDMLSAGECINSKDWSPAELTGCWSVPAAEEQETEPEAAAANEYPFSAYSGKDLLERMAQLREKYARKEKPVPISRKIKPETFRPPSGDISFKV